MDWDLCKTFVAVAETRSFAAAARQLRSSHPTVGRKVAELENQLGIPLFARSNDGLSLTAQGRKFREHVEAMAAAALRAEAAVSATGAQARGVVKLSIGSTLASHWLMPRLGFLRAHDHIQIEIITHPFPASVRRREADVVLRPVDGGEENLIGRRIGRLGTGFYSSRNYAAGESCRNGATSGRGTASSALPTAPPTNGSRAGAISSRDRERWRCGALRRATCWPPCGPGSASPRCHASSRLPIRIWSASRRKNSSAWRISGCWRIRTWSISPPCAR